MKSIWDVIKGPVITEKALMMKEELESMVVGTPLRTTRSERKS